jgi:small GTP-binding protein
MLPLSTERRDLELTELIRSTRVFVKRLAEALSDFASEIERVESGLSTSANLSGTVQASRSISQALQQEDVMLDQVTDTTQVSQEAVESPDIYQVKTVEGSDSSLSNAAEKILTSQVGAIEQGLKERHGTRLKIALAGRAAVGKTTLFNLLKGLESPAAYHATIGADVDRKLFQIDGTRVIVWDLAGQQEYHKTWVIFLRGAALILFVSDSSLENVVSSKPLLDLCRRVEPNAQIICIANKQDLPSRLKPEEIQKQLGVKTYGCVAIDPAYREGVMSIIVQSVRNIINRGANPLDQPTL